MDADKFLEYLYHIKIGQFAAFDNRSAFTRVPGGWVYGDMDGTCFIPFIEKERAYDNPKL